MFPAQTDTLQPKPIPTKSPKKMQHSFSYEITDSPQVKYKSTVESLSYLTSSELQSQRCQLLNSDKCTSDDLDKIVAIEEILNQRGEKPVNVSPTKLKPWVYVLGGVAAGLLGVNLIGGGNQPAYYQAQPQQTNPNVVSVPAGSGATVFNFDND